MKWITLILITVVVLEVIGGRVANKCCKQDEILRLAGGSFECTEDSSRRVQVRATTTDFLRKNESGQCFDVIGGEVFVLTIGDEGIDWERAPDKFFPKCCPLDHVYNSDLRGCIKKLDAVDFYEEAFVRVGLPDCRLIVDNVLNGTDDFRYRLLNHTGRFKRDALYPGSYCIDRTENDSLVLRECQESLRACEGIKCIKKCCADGQSFVNGAKCVDTYEYGLNLSVFGNIIEKPNERAPLGNEIFLVTSLALNAWMSGWLYSLLNAYASGTLFITTKYRPQVVGDPFAIIHNATCSKIHKMEEDEHFILDEHGVFTEIIDQEINPSESNTDLASYCIEHAKKGNLEGYYFFTCIPDTEKSLTKFDYTFWPLVMSCVLLALTILIYVVLNETRKMFGKILVNYCVATFFAFAFLTYAQLNTCPTSAECQIKAFCIIFFAVASFTWSNIMCCDIWCTFGSTKRYLGTTQRNMDFTKLLLYSLYGWGVPLLLTFVIFIFHKWRVLPYPIQPYLAEVKCFFDNKPGNFAKDFFYNIPLLIIQMVNMVLFIKTVLYCLEVKNDINRINDTTKDDKMKRYKSDRERLFLILKLLVIMGISYIFEVVSAFFDMSKMGIIPQYIELIWDTVNALQGVFIFVIFICKKKIIQGCLEKFKMVERHSSNSSFHTSSLNLISINGFSLNQFGNPNKAFK